MLTRRGCPSIDNTVEVVQLSRPGVRSARFRQLQTINWQYGNSHRMLSPHHELQDPRRSGDEHNTAQSRRQPFHGCFGGPLSITIRRGITAKVRFWAIASPSTVMLVLVFNLHGIW